MNHTPQETADFARAVVERASLNYDGTHNVGAARVALELLETHPGVLGAVMSIGVTGEVLYKLWNDHCERSCEAIAAMSEDDLITFASFNHAEYFLKLWTEKGVV